MSDSTYWKPHPRWLRIWHWLYDDSPDWWPERLTDGLIDAYSWMICKVRGHTTWVEMDGHSICCVICHHKVGDTRLSVARPEEDT